MWSVLSNFLYPPAAATELLAYQAGRGQFWPKSGLPNFWQCCGRYSRHPGQGMTSCRGRGFFPAYRVLKPQAQQPRPACWGTPGHQPALELQSTVSPHPSQISLWTRTSLIGRSHQAGCQQDRKPTGPAPWVQRGHIPPPTALSQSSERPGHEIPTSFQGAAPCRRNIQIPLTGPAPHH